LERHGIYFDEMPSIIDPIIMVITPVICINDIFSLRKKKPRMQVRAMWSAAKGTAMLTRRAPSDSKK